MNYIFAVLFLSILFSAPISASASAKNLPVEAFSQIPQSYNVTLSPNGRYLAFFHNVANDTVLVTIDLSTGKKYGITKTDNKKFKFRKLIWASDDHLLFSAAYPSTRTGRIANIKTIDTRLFVSPPDKANAFKRLIKIKPEDRQRTKGDYELFAQIQDKVIDVLPDDPEHILVSIAIDEYAHDSVYKINLEKYTKFIAKRPMKPVRRWGTDQQGRIRIGHGLDDSERSIYLKDLATDKWFKAWTYDSFSEDQVQALGFGIDPNILYVRAYHQGNLAIFTVDITNKDLPLELKYHDPDYDVLGGLIYSRKTRDVIGVYHSEEGDRRIYWNEQHISLSNGINKALPDTSNIFVSFSEDERKYILLTTSDRVPGHYYIGDRDKGRLDPILTMYPGIDETLLTERKLVSYKARDGLTIEAYLTLPRGEKNKPLPVVILPHGGPIYKSFGGFHYWAAFFANRGYAVLEPNFRGSLGYGFNFMAQSLGNWGGEMQDDLTDAAQWLIDEGIADKNRLCIVGASYGGYAALMATVKTPELFACAVSFAGISDVDQLRSRTRFFITHDEVRLQLGEGNLDNISPLYHINKIKTPILLAHGEQDRFVSVEQSRKFAKRLDAEGKEYKYIELPDGSHSLTSQENRTLFFSEMDDFLKQHLSKGQR